MLMEFCPGLATQFRVAALKPLAKARRELALGARQPAALASLPREQVQRERDSPERLRPEVPAWR